jgi:hypothetical protein
MTNPQNLRQLIVDRSRELGLNPLTLGLRLDYTNPLKAAGRVQALCDGHISNRKSKAALASLGAALAVPEQSSLDRCTMPQRENELRPKTNIPEFSRETTPCRSWKDNNRTLRSSGSEDN